jgi:large subunit ribosomal protein L35
MPKIKTHKGMQDRVKISATGKIMHKKVGRNHLLTNKGRANKKFSLGKQLDVVYTTRVAHLLPYL